MNHHCTCNHQLEPIQHSPDCACCFNPPANIGAAAVEQHEDVRFGNELPMMRAIGHMSDGHEVYGTNYDTKPGKLLVWKISPYVGLVSRHVGYPDSWRLTCTSYFMRGQYWEKRV